MTIAITPKPSDGPAFRVRAGRRGDADSIATLFAELGYPGTPDSSSVHWVISHPEMEVIIAADSLDKAVGVITLSHRPQLRMKGRIATIDELVVSSAWRRRGVGKALVRRAIERAKILSVRRIELLTHGPLTPELTTFFHAVGFDQAEVSVFRLGELDFQKSR
ncbi:MAG: GNAT family N-acetyltransferase [Myxococcota bacterium]|nr:GNAT family N-acetyltransferase [Myxococcota bacterium]